LERVVFGEARPASGGGDTPNAEYNSLFPNLAPASSAIPTTGSNDRADSKPGRIDGSTYGYWSAFSGIPAGRTKRGTPTQMVVFTR